MPKYMCRKYLIAQKYKIKLTLDNEAFDIQSKKYSTPTVPKNKIL